MISTKTKLLSAASLLMLFVLAGCRSDMQDQPRFIPLRKSDFYEDQRSSRPVIVGTVARGQLRDDTYFYTGMIGKDAGNVMPFPVTRQVLARGQERYNIYCSPCHSEVGDGNGMIVQRGYRRPPSYHIDRLRNAPLGHFFDVITNGFGAMPDYASQVQPADRWAIIAYIRALQYSQNAPAGSVPTGAPTTPPALKGSVPTGAVQPTFQKPGEKGGEHE